MDLWKLCEEEIGRRLDWNNLFDCCLFEDWKREKRYQKCIEEAKMQNNKGE